MQLGETRLAIAAGDDSISGLLAPYMPPRPTCSEPTAIRSAPASRSVGFGFIGRAVRAVANAHQRRSAMVLQAFNWSSYPNAGHWPAPRWPTGEEMRQMRDLAVRTADPSLILWYSFFDIHSSAAFWSHWRDLVWAAFGT
jgi:hypothetical protein